MKIDEFFLRRAAVGIGAMTYWVGVALHARRIRKSIGKSANLKPRTSKEKLLWLGWALMILGWLFQPLLISRANLAESWCNQATLAAGLTLTALGYACTLWCYAAMGDTWRIGVNRNEKTSLITRGPYRVIRHPIYVFQLVMLIGAAMLLPGLGSLIIVALQFVCVKLKAADEEAYLLSVHGPAYQAYLNRTGGLFPRLFKR